ncbi:MAG: hypothetical protein KRP56_06395 [Candidatus Methanogranum gryphiswaldense]|nr:MAG: hypothetical protein KRP56_06395 [Candidatus Methanogranum sp. U3.2.1]
MGLFKKEKKYSNDALARIESKKKIECMNDQKIKEDQKQKDTEQRIIEIETKKLESALPELFSKKYGDDWKNDIDLWGLILEDYPGSYFIACYNCKIAHTYKDDWGDMETIEIYESGQLSEPLYTVEQLKRNLSREFRPNCPHLDESRRITKYMPTKRIGLHISINGKTPILELKYKK